MELNDMAAPTEAQVEAEMEPEILSSDRSGFRQLGALLRKNATIKVRSPTL